MEFWKPHFTSQKAPQPWVRLKGGVIGCWCPKACEVLCCSIPRAVACVGENFINAVWSMKEDGEPTSCFHQAFHAGCKQYYWVKISPVTSDFIMKTPCSKLEINTLPSSLWLFDTKLQTYIHIVKIIYSSEYTVILYFGSTRKFLVFQDT